MATRTPNARTARTATTAPRVEEIHAAQEEPSIAERFNKAAEDYMASLKIEWSRRRVVAMVLGCVTAFGGGYMVGQLLMPLIIAALLSGSLFLATVIYVFTFVLGMYVGGKLGGAMYEYVATGKAEEHFHAAKSWVKGLFSRSDVITA